MNIDYENNVIDLDDFLDENYIYIRGIIEIAGSPKEFVEDLIKELNYKMFNWQTEGLKIKLNKEELKEKVDEVMKNELDLIEELKKEHDIKDEDRNFILIKTYGSEVKEVEGSPLFSAFLEFEALVKDIKELLKFGVNFTPSNIEIIEPSKLKVTNLELQDFMNEYIHILGQLFNNLKNCDAENKMLKEQLSKTIKPGFRSPRTK